MKRTSSAVAAAITSMCAFAVTSFAAGHGFDWSGNPSAGNVMRSGVGIPVSIDYDNPPSLSLIPDPAGDQGAGPVYGDCLQAGVTNAPGRMTVAQKINGTFPARPTGDVAAYSWRFDTDLNPNTGFQQYPYIGIEWEILIQDGGGFWTVNKWSQSTSYLPVPSARVRIRHIASGDMVFVSFDPAEIGSPTSSNWIVWNGFFPTWVDLAPDATVAFWTQ